jgi:hypothetical protein
MSSNESASIACEQSNKTITIYSFNFNECLKYFLLNSIPLTIVNFSMCLITTLANTILIYLLIKKQCTQIVFDRILISHAFNDLITNLLDLPMYNFILIFKHFLFGNPGKFLRLRFTRNYANTDA